MNRLWKVLQRYEFFTTINEVVEYGEGHINETYKVTTSDGRKFIVQKINEYVFKEPRKVQENISKVTAFIRDKDNLAERRTLEVIPSIDGEELIIVEDTYWRCYNFIQGAAVYESAKVTGMLYEVGRAIGMFQRQLQDFDISKLNVTIEDFHHTPKRFEHLMDVVMLDPLGRAKEVEKELRFIKDRSKDLSVIQNLIDEGKIRLRVVHNDTKINNVMLDEKTGEAVCMIDLDTVMPGSILFDFGDAVRAGATTAGEEETNLENVALDMYRFKEFAYGYLSEMYDTLDEIEWAYLIDSCKIMALEVAIRFLADYIDGDKYFRIKHREDNLVRARTQLKMVAEVEAHYEEMKRVIHRFREIRMEDRSEK